MSNISKSPKGNLKTITLEEHFATTSFLNGPGAGVKERPQAAHLIKKLCDLGEGRISEMDEAGIDMQVLSLTAPGVEQLEANEAISLACETNDILAEAIRRYPNRFAGFATLPTALPERAADELERTVRNYGFKGAVINGHIQGKYLDNSFFWPILERAEALQVPIYLHPTPPPKSVIEASYKGNYSVEIMNRLATSAWGWHIETAIHALRLILSGAFDRYPRLQIIIGHLGEAIPFMLQRIDRQLPVAETKLKHEISYYLRNNLYYTVSGFNFVAPFLDLFLEVGANRILFSADYPYGSMSEARRFLDQLPLSPYDKEGIAYRNAESLLRLK